MTPNRIYLSAILTCALTWSIQPIAGSGFCDGKADGNYRDPDNCNGYISCTNQITVPMDCPANLKYNEAKDECDYPENVDCDPGNFCENRADGNYRDPNNCHVYVACSNCRTFHMPCARPGLVFNEDKNKCVYPRELACWSE